MFNSMSPRGIFLERSVGLVKSPLRRVQGRALSKYDEMDTLKVEIEYIVNDKNLPMLEREMTFLLSHQTGC